MPLRRRYFLIAIIFSLVVLVICTRHVWFPKYDNVEEIVHDHFQPKRSGQKKSLSSEYEKLPCKINQEVRKNIGLPNKKEDIDCLYAEADNEVFIPFSFIQKYFDVYGQKSISAKSRYFSMSHSYSKVFQQFKRQKYNSSDVYMQFHSFDVEHRPRVKCVSARTGVPITTQWDKKGYYYATQICQFGLAHWSKALLLNGNNESMVVFEDGYNTINGAEWMSSEVNRVSRDKCVHFDSTPASIQFRKQFPGIFVINFDLLIRDAPSVTIAMNHDKFGLYYINYNSMKNQAISRIGRKVTMGFAGENGEQYPEGTFKSFNRNLLNDLSKGLPHNDQTVQMFKQGQSWTIKSVTFEGVGCVTNISLSKSSHMKMFYNAAKWLLDNQNPKTGAWHVDVPFNHGNSKYPSANEIPQGWISGMGSGHALSVLTRAFKNSADQRYLKAAIRALKPFKNYTHQGGIKARFLDKYDWFEEYPTNPNSFVLNGFMYALLGLYDLWQTLEEYNTVILNGENNDALYNPNQDSKSLFEHGLISLVSLLPLYDTGSGTTYDLRHMTMGGPPKLARWDYHSTHINLLYTLSTICNNENQKKIMVNTADRWLKYMIGQKAEHN